MSTKQSILGSLAYCCCKARVGVLTTAPEVIAACVSQDAFA